MKFVNVTVENPVVAVLWKREWVYLPVLHIPDGAEYNGRLMPFHFELSEDTKDEPAGTRYGPAVMSYVPRAEPTRCLIPWTLPVPKLRQLCESYDIPLYWVVGSYRSVARGGETNSRDREVSNRKIPPLTKGQYSIFKKQIVAQSPRDALIAEILWYLNGRLCEGSYITLEELLRLRWCDVSRDEYGLITPKFKRYALGGHIVCICLPEKLSKRLRQQSVRDSPFVFANRYGAPLSATVIGRRFGNAGKSAGLGMVSLIF